MAVLSINEIARLPNSTLIARIKYHIKTGWQRPDTGALLNEFYYRLQMGRVEHIWKRGSRTVEHGL